MVIIREVARDLRKHQTQSEKIFWELVRNRRLCGRKFLRQYVIRLKIEEKIRFFIADFYCAESKLIIEVDGGIHEKMQDNDKMRDIIIGELGMKVIRIRNEELEDLSMIKDRILSYL